ncbi:uncharacterized protein LOC121984577 isoform X1 [Zingiber officinale]|uniref:uncharacterized protein LOC121984577 isoform X1 n=1 Tax=Zingiber officinale TaxID=94328 RepID=UPI001C4D7F80|nr:uncharacterized protein LOC121984577 isoform X1 [Zingiber officinale]
MEKVGDSHSSSDPVSPTSNEMMKEPPRRLDIGTPEICFEKIKSVFEKLKGVLSLLFIGLSLLFSTSYSAIMGVMIRVYLHTQKYELGESGRNPKMPIPDIARRTEVLYHGEKKTEFGNYHNGIDRTVRAMDCIQSKTSRVSALQVIASQVSEVANTKITMKHSKK